MERIASGMLERKIKMIALHGVKLQLDHHQPGGAEYTWAVQDERGYRHSWSGRMKARECLIHLDGILYGLEKINGPRYLPS